MGMDRDTVVKKTNVVQRDEYRDLLQEALEDLRPLRSAAKPKRPCLPKWKAAGHGANLPTPPALLLTARKFRIVGHLSGSSG